MSEPHVHDANPAPLFGSDGQNYTEEIVGYTCTECGEQFWGADASAGADRLPDTCARCGEFMTEGDPCPASGNRQPCIAAASAGADPATPPGIDPATDMRYREGADPMIQDLRPAASAGADPERTIVFGADGSYAEYDRRLTHEEVDRLRAQGGPSLDVEQLHKWFGHEGEGVGVWTVTHPRTGERFYAFAVKDVHEAIDAFAARLSVGKTHA